MVRLLCLHSMSGRTNMTSIPNLFSLYYFHRLGLYDTTSIVIYNFDGRTPSKSERRNPTNVVRAYWIASGMRDTHIQPKRAMP
jgi:hypothetical protein